MDNPPNRNIQIDKQQSTEQTILLKAIQKKFENSENHSGTSPPVFSIPSLKFPQFSTTSSSLDCNDKAPSSTLNQFILGKLTESKALTSSGSFAIPDLKLQTQSNSPSITLAEKFNLNNKNANESKINALNKGISNLRLREEGKPHVIDLTTALNQSSTMSASPAKQSALLTSKPIDFQIPFIDCDLQEVTMQLPLANEQCETDVSEFVHRRFITAPSKFGKITCLRYRLPKHSIDHSFVEKHKITRFGFDTKSPDDIVLASIRRCNRV